MEMRSLDRVTTFYYPRSQVRITLANVTDTARTLERNHLCGPIAGLVQAELIGAATLLGTLIEAPGEKITLRVSFPNGQLGGATLECTSDYKIRGYTRQKVLPQLDDSPEPAETLFACALGSSAQCAVIRTTASGYNDSTQFNFNAQPCLTITDIVEEFFCTSLQRHAFAQLSAGSKEGYVACAHALLCEFLPDASEDLAERIGQVFDGGFVQDVLDAGASIDSLTHLFGLEEPRRESEHPVCFFCGCSSASVLKMLQALPRSELEAMLSENRSFDVYCHMCGKGYTITPAQIAMCLHG